MSPIERQLQILRVLAAHRRGVSLKELASRFEMSEKSIRRDLKRLIDAQFPIRQTTEDFGRRRWRLEGDPIGGVLGFDEAYALVVAVESLGVLRPSKFGQAAASGLDKLTAGMNRVALDYCRTMGRTLAPLTTRRGRYDDDAWDRLDTMMVAHEERRVCFLTYQSRRSTEPLTYPVHVYAFREHRGSVYVIGHSEQHDEVRCFKLDRISQAHCDEVRFQPPDRFDADAFLSDALGIHTGSPETVRIWIAPSAARAIIETRWHQSQTHRDLPGGAIEITLQVAINPETISWILSIGPDAKVLHPESLADEVQTAAEKILQRYRAPVTEEPNW